MAIPTIGLDRTSLLVARLGSQVLINRANDPVFLIITTAEEFCLSAISERTSIAASHAIRENHLPPLSVVKDRQKQREREGGENEFAA